MNRTFKAGVCNELTFDLVDWLDSQCPSRERIDEMLDTNQMLAEFYDTLRNKLDKIIVVRDI